MKAHFNLLDSSGKKRIIIFTIITVIAEVIAVLGVRVFCVNAHNPQYIPDPEPIIFDGADFAPLVSLIMIFPNYLLWMLHVGIHLLFSWLFDFAAYILFGASAVKNSFVSNAEYIIAKSVFTVLLIISIVISHLIALFNSFIDIYIFTFYSVIYIALIMIPVWLFGYLF